MFELCKTFKYVNFTVYGRKQTKRETDIHTFLQCSPVSMGLTQARPNYYCCIPTVDLYSTYTSSLRGVSLMLSAS